MLVVFIFRRKKTLSSLSATPFGEWNDERGDVPIGLAR